MHNYRYRYSRSAVRPLLEVIFDGNISSEFLKGKDENTTLSELESARNKCKTDFLRIIFDLSIQLHTKYLSANTFMIICMSFG
jgi:hypothetical protein